MTLQNREKCCYRGETPVISHAIASATDTINFTPRSHRVTTPGMQLYMRPNGLKIRFNSENCFNMYSIGWTEKTGTTISTRAWTRKSSTQWSAFRNIPWFLKGPQKPLDSNLDFLEKNNFMLPTTYIFVLPSHPFTGFTKHHWQLCKQYLGHHNLRL